MASKRLLEWVEANQGKHFCQCGCGKVIVITVNHGANGIPEYIHGHSGRTRTPKYGYLTNVEKDAWREANQGKHRCHCGCNKVIEITKHHFINGIPKFICGHHNKLSREIKPFEHYVELFWSQVDRKGEDECWLWTGRRVYYNYGAFSCSGYMPSSSAHRFSYYLANGKFDFSLDVLHRCDNPPCVNPNHLFLGTQRDNTLDAAKKGKYSKKLSPKQVLSIVDEVQEGKFSRAAIARKYNVVPSTITGIMNGYLFYAITGLPRLYKGASNGGGVTNTVRDGENRLFSNKK